MKISKYLYCILFFAICLLPFAGMSVMVEESSSENRELSEFPSLITEDGWNLHWLSEAGDYFQEHFAFRQKLVTANAILNGKIMGVSSASGVIQGSDGWLYYKDSLNDYIGKELLSERSLFNLAHTLSMTQNMLKEQGINFVFAIAPNKNSLYDENMPYYFKWKVSEDKNAENLAEYLEAEGVAYVDLFETLKSYKDVLYHERDSHWNNQGAYIAGDALLKELEKEHRNYDEEAFEIRKDFEGDLDKMLYPEAISLENEIYYETPPSFEYVEEVSSNFEPRITTKNSSAQGNLVMYRDSFGNALLSYMAEAYENAYFSRGVPYQMTADIQLNEPESIVIVRAERFLPEMATAAPVLQAAAAVTPETVESISLEGADMIQVKPLGTLTQISGRVKAEYLDERSQIYIKFGNGLCYEAFLQDIETEDSVDPGGFCLYIASEELVYGMENFEVLTYTEGNYQSVGVGQVPSEMLMAPVLEESIDSSLQTEPTDLIVEEVVG